MSQKSNQALALIEWHEKEGSWPCDVRRSQWQGSLEATWLEYIGKNLLKEPTNDLKRLNDVDIRFNRGREGSFVYLWRFCVMGRVFHKVGVTASLQSRFKTFRTLIPKKLMSFCEVRAATVVGGAGRRGESENIEVDFIVACRRFYLDNEWFDFEVETP